MNATVNLSHPTIQALNAAVSAEYQCSEEIVYGVFHNPAKFTAVFILVHFFGFKPKDLSAVYHIDRRKIYPVVVEFAMLTYGISEEYRQRLHRILNKIEDFEL